MDSLTTCAPFVFNNDSIIKMEQNGISLAPGIERQISRWKATELLPKAAGLFNLLAAYSKQAEINTVYNLVNSSGKLNAGQQAWLDYYYNFAKSDFQAALTHLQSINSSSENEQQTIKLESIKTGMWLQNLTPRKLNAADIAALKSIAAAALPCSPKAYDLLKQAVDGYDYPFRPIALQTQEHGKNVTSLAASALKVYPNPASNNLTLELINATEGNAIITVFDALGQSVYQAQTNVKAGKVSIDISSFAKGMYHLQVLGIEDKNLVTTFIKQ